MEIIVGTIIKKDSKYLMVREKKAGAYGKWNFPSGHLEKGESLKSGAIRETLEETGYSVELEGLFPVITIAEESIVKVTFSAKIIKKENGYHQNEISSVCWFDCADIRNMFGRDEIRGSKLNLKLFEFAEEENIRPLNMIEEI